ncbi:anti-sigma factor domain-containing protein [Streptomyces sp. NPDC048111]|uniref:anti-sigma factor n=1 Tax=Streptomyces sp. NPDC048111 TaxID=3365500 RepID=UPI0037160D80
MISADLHTLTGAYALHALFDDENEHVERHLSACPSCTQEVRELDAAAGRLGLATTLRPRAAFKEDVLRRISHVRQEAPRTWRPLPSRRATGRRGAMTSYAVAACLITAVGLGGVTAWEQRQSDIAREQVQATQRQAQQLADVLAAPDARAVHGRIAGGGVGTIIVARSRNQAVFLASGLPRPSAGMVYQLWFDEAGFMRPAGLVNPARTTAAVLLSGPVDQASGMAITVEPTGGSARPTSARLALMAIPDA